MISQILREGSADTATFLNFVRATDRLPILFGDEIAAYSNATRETTGKLGYHGGQVRPHLSGGRAVENFPVPVEREYELMNELSKFHDEFAALIVPYVRMTQKLR